MTLTTDRENVISAEFLAEPYSSNFLSESYVTSHTSNLELYAAPPCFQ